MNDTKYLYQNINQATFYVNTHSFIFSVLELKV